MSKTDLQRIFGDTEDDSADMDNIFDSAENQLEFAETFRDGEKLESVSVSSAQLHNNNKRIPSLTQKLHKPTSAKNTTMAHVQNNRNLHLLAAVALGTYVEEKQQPARTIPEEDLLREGQQPTHATPRDNSPHDDEQRAQASPYQGFAAINSAMATGRLAPNNPLPPSHVFTAINSASPAARLASNNLRPPHHGMTASTGAPQRVTKRKATPRTTGFNQETGSGLLTAVCARVTPSKGTPVPHRSGAGGPFRCPRCHCRFTKPRSVKDHFIKCVNNYGNPAGLNWFDHPSLAKSKNWHLQHMPKEEEEEEEGEVVEEDEKDEMEGDDDESQHLGVSLSLRALDCYDTHHS